MGGTILETTGVKAGGQGGLQAVPIPKAPMGYARLGGAALGVPSLGMKGLRGPVQLCSADVRYADEAEQVL